jgi:hypothetical protein
MKITKIDDLVFAIKFDSEEEAAASFANIKNAPVVGSYEERAFYHDEVVKNEILKYMKMRYGTKVSLMKNVISRRVALTSIFQDERGLIANKIEIMIREMLDCGLIRYSRIEDKINDSMVSLTPEGAQYVRLIK